MVIVLPLVLRIKEYLQEYGDKSLDMELRCSYCGRRLRRHGRYFRSVVLGPVLYRIPIYRRFCPRCRRWPGRQKTCQEARRQAISKAARANCPAVLTSSTAKGGRHWR